MIQKYLEFNRCSSRKEAEVEIDDLIDEFYNSNIHSYVEFANNYKNLFISF